MHCTDALAKVLKRVLDCHQSDHQLLPKSVAASFRMLTESAAITDLPRQAVIETRGNTNHELKVTL